MTITRKAFTFPSRWQFWRFALGQLDYILPRSVRRLRHVRCWPVEWRERIHHVTEDERVELARARHRAHEDSKERKQLKKIVGEYKRLLSNALTRAGAAYRFKDEGARIIKRIKFRNPIRASKEAIWFQVETARLPWHVLIAYLKAPEVTETVSFACGRRVRCIADDPEKGVWYVVELKQGVHGVPRNVDYNRMMESLKPEAPPLAICIGAGQAGRLYYRDIADMPHMIVAGATGSGKSVWIKQVLTTLLTRNDKGRAIFIMIDMKGGVELSQFKDAPNLLLPIIKEKRDVGPTLERVLREVRRRLIMFEKMGVVNIQAYNQRHRPTMAYWVLVIDELAHLMLDPSLKKDSEILLADIAALSRAAGIHVIAATQRPSVDVVTGLIKANFPVRIAFSTASQADSRVIIDTGDACQIAPQGRMIFFMGNTKVEVQGPFISPQLIDETMSRIVGGKREEALDARKRHGITSIDLFRYALGSHDGRVDNGAMWQAFKMHNLRRDEVRNMLSQYDNQEVEIDGTWYKLMPPYMARGCQMPRKLVLIETPDVVTADDAIDAEAYDAADPQPNRSDVPAFIDWGNQEIATIPDVAIAASGENDGKNGSNSAEEDTEPEYSADEFQPTK